MLRGWAGCLCLHTWVGRERRTVTHSTSSTLATTPTSRTSLQYKNFYTGSPKGFVRGLKVGAAQRAHWTARAPSSGGKRSRSALR